MKFKYVLFIVFISLFLLPLEFTLAQPIPFPLEKRVKALESKVSELEAKMRQLESMNKPSPELPQAQLKSYKEGWKDIQNWRYGLKKGMTKEEVRDLLGEPSKVDVYSFYENWYYPKGKVEFSEKGFITSWNEP
jgi:hypothetical protein